MKHVKPNLKMKWRQALTIKKKQNTQFPLNRNIRYSNYEGPFRWKNQAHLLSARGQASDARLSVKRVSCSAPLKISKTQGNIEGLARGDFNSKKKNFVPGLFWINKRSLGAVSGGQDKSNWRFSNKGSTFAFGPRRFRWFELRKQIKRIIKKKRSFLALVKSKLPLIGSKEVKYLSHLSKNTYGKARNWNNVALIKKENIINKRISNLKTKQRLQNLNNSMLSPAYLKLLNQTRAQRIQRPASSVVVADGLRPTAVRDPNKSKRLTDKQLVQVGAMRSLVAARLSDAHAKRVGRTVNSNILPKMFIDQEGPFNLKDHVLRYSKFNPKLATSYSIGYNYNKKSQRMFRNKTFIFNNSINNFFYTESTLISRPVFVFNNGNIDVKIFYFLPEYYAPVTRKGGAGPATEGWRGSSIQASKWRVSDSAKRSESERNTIAKAHNKRKKGLSSLVPVRLLAKRKISSYLIKNGKKKKLVNSISFNPNYLKHLISFGIGLICCSDKKVNLDLTRLKYPYHNSQILAKFIGDNANLYRLRRIIKKIFFRFSIPKIKAWDKRKNRTLIQSNLINKNMDMPLGSVAHPHRLSARATGAPVAMGMKSTVTEMLLGLRNVQPTLSPIASATNEKRNLPLIAKSPKKNSVSCPSDTSNYTKPERAHVSHDTRPAGAFALSKSASAERAIPAQPLNKSDFVSFIFGIKIKLAGRLMSQRFRPRHTVTQKQKGYVANSKSHVLDQGRFTGKNKRGAFSITVKINHDDHLNK